jgi:hypothetical protein
VNLPEVMWNPEFGPRRPIGPCPHDCTHTVVLTAAIAPERERSTLAQCRTCTCRAWLPEEPVYRVIRTADWIELEREPLDAVRTS